MSWFGNIRTFHASALNLLAGSLARCPNLPWEKVGASRDHPTKLRVFLLPAQVQRLLAHCPQLAEPSSSEAPSVALHDRALSGVVALGVFAVESGLGLHGDRVLGYLLQLLRVLPRASWVQNTLAAAKRGGLARGRGREVEVLSLFTEGLIVEQFCYKLGLILTQIAARSPDHHSQVRSHDHHVMIM